MHQQITQKLILNLITQIKSLSIITVIFKSIPIQIMSTPLQFRN
jgi:hypothetical protein